MVLGFIHYIICLFVILLSNINNLNIINNFNRIIMPFRVEAES